MRFQQVDDEKKERTFLGLPLRRYLLYLIVFCFMMTGVSLSRYVTVSEGQDGAQVISFGNATLTMSGTLENAKYVNFIEPGVPIHQVAKVSFEGSDKKSIVFIKVTPDAGWTQEGSAEDGYRFSYGDVFNTSTQKSEAALAWELDNTQWQFLQTDDSGTSFIYYKLVEPSVALTDVPLIKSDMITVSEYLTRKNMEVLPNDLGIHFKIYVVQADEGSENEDDVTLAGRQWQLTKSN